MRLLLAAIALGTLGVLLFRKPQRVAARPYVEPEDGVQPVDPYITTRYFPDGSWRYEPVSR